MFCFHYNNICIIMYPLGETNSLWQTCSVCTNSCICPYRELVYIYIYWCKYLIISTFRLYQFLLQAVLWFLFIPPGGLPGYRSGSCCTASGCEGWECSGARSECAGGGGEECGGALCHYFCSLPLTAATPGSYQQGTCLFMKSLSVLFLTVHCACAFVTQYCM